MSFPSSPEPFTFIDSPTPPRLYNKYAPIFGGQTISVDVQMSSILRSLYPELNLTKVPANNCSLLAFAYAGNAIAEQDTITDHIDRFRGYVPGYKRGEIGRLGDAVSFAKYHYIWAGEDFILYTIQEGFIVVQYILKEIGPGETQISHSKITDTLLSAIGEWQASDNEVIYLYDGYWRKDHELWQQVQRANWDNVILDAEMKKTLTEVVGKFFDSMGFYNYGYVRKSGTDQTITDKSVYDDLDVPWKRGLIFYGPAGNGKTISLKGELSPIMHTLSVREDPIPTLYVKSASATYDIRNIWVVARRMAPCLLVLEDIDTIVTQKTRAYAFNEIDGLENNEGILMIATTNHLDVLDPGLTKRPSRFDRKYLFPLPSKDERSLYCTYWRQKLLPKQPQLKFPKKLCPAIANITDGFSFAYMKEAFVSTLLTIAKKRTESSGSQTGLNDEDDDDDLDDYELWREIKKQVKVLRDDMDSSSPSTFQQADIMHVRYDEEDPRIKSMLVNRNSSLPTSHSPDKIEADKFLVQDLPYRFAKPVHYSASKPQNSHPLTNLSHNPPTSSTYPPVAETFQTSAPEPPLYSRLGAMNGSTKWDRGAWKQGLARGGARRSWGVAEGDWDI